MFSLFRKGESGESLSQPNVLSSSPTSASDSLETACDGKEESRTNLSPGISEVDGSQSDAGESHPAPVSPSSQPTDDGGDSDDISASPPAASRVTSFLGSYSDSYDDYCGGLSGWLEPDEEFQKTTVEVPPESDVLRDAALLKELTAGKKTRARGKRLEHPTESATKRTITPSQRLLLLDAWRRSGLPAGDFAPLVGIAKHTLYKWNQQFKELGPAGLMDQRRGASSGSRVSEVTKRTILMLKQSHPEWGCQRISDMLLRGPALPASASTVARVLHEAGYEMVQEPTRSHPDKVRRFERARPNQLWQTDLFTFLLKRQNRRVYLVAFMDDHSRFIVSYGLHASASTALVLEALEAGISSYGPPEEVLTDNGPQYVTWRGKSQFTRRLEQHGIRQIVARPRRPQTLGKIERFWGSLWREFLETAVFADLAEARTRIGLFIDYHNFQRVHRGIDGLVPADRFFGAATEVSRTLKERVAANSLELARHGEPRAPFYVTGQLDGQSFSVHAEGRRFILTRPGQTRQEVELTAPADAPADAPVDDQPPSVGEQGEQAWPLPAPVCPDGSPPVDAAPDAVEEGSRDAQPGGDA
jgi:transposase InsO family protein